MRALEKNGNWKKWLGPTFSVEINQRLKAIRKLFFFQEKMFEF
jgi:hypothetical protein